MTEPARYPLIVATDRPPLARPDTSPVVQAYAQAPLMQAVALRGGVWVAAGTSQTKPSLWLNPLRLEDEILTAHRDGYCANTLASIYFGHDGTTPPQDAGWTAAHQTVSRQYARHIAALALPGANVWIHDYSLQLVPGLLRDLRPDLRIGYSWHSPFPAAGSLLTVAEHDQILSSLLATDLIGFPDLRSAANFTGYAHATGHSSTAATVMPRPAETHAIARLSESSTARVQAGRIRHRLQPANTILLAVGGSDPGDGTLTVLHEYQQLLIDGKLDPRSTVLIHLTRPGAAPEDDPTRQDTERLIAQINGNHANLGHLPVQHQRGPFTPGELAAFYLAADVMLAVPTRDRTTYEAAEYVTARSDGTGRLVLSEFSTATSQLPAAQSVNPHAPGALAEAMLRAVSYAKTRSSNMLTMREQALSNTVSSWAPAFLHALSRSVSRTPAVAGRLPQRGQMRLGQPHHAAHDRLAATGSHP